MGDFFSIQGIECKISRDFFSRETVLESCLVTLGSDIELSVSE